MVRVKFLVNAKATHTHTHTRCCKLNALRCLVVSHGPFHCFCLCVLERWQFWVSVGFLCRGVEPWATTRTAGNPNCVCVTHTHTHTHTHTQVEVSLFKVPKRKKGERKRKCVCVWGRDGSKARLLGKASSFFQNHTWTYTDKPQPCVSPPGSLVKTLILRPFKRNKMFLWALWETHFCLSLFPSS